ncbi:MAG: MFS transporter [Oscillospiraceae bacterium]|nr:MFS transporter [Oscillospiraceae bacterium]
MRNSKTTQEVLSGAVGSWEPPKTIWNGMFISIFFTNMALSMGQQMSNTLLSVYANSFGAPADQIGQLMSMFAVTALIFRFISGPAMNAYNRKKLVAMAMGFMATAYLGFSNAQLIADFVGVKPIAVLMAFRLLQGVGNAFGSACCLTMVSDTLPKDKFTTGMGYYACAQVVAQAIGPTVGVFLRDWIGYSKTYVVIFFVMCFAIFTSTHVKLAPRERVPFNLKLGNIIAKEALIPAGVTFLVATGFTAINAFLMVYTEERGIPGGSLFFTVYAVTMLVTRPLVGRLTERFGFVKVAIPCVFMTAVSLVMIGYSGNMFWLLLSAFVNAFGYGAVQPMLQSLCMKAVGPERRGSASGTNYIGMDSATILGPMICGKVADALGYEPIIWIVMTVPILIGMIAIFVLRKNIAAIEKRFQG